MKSPSFPFYVNNWLASGKVTAMTPEQEGGYIHLLAHAWNQDDCMLPDDDKKLASLSRLNDRWEECKKEILECFKKSKGRIFNERLLHEKETQDQFREKRSQAGIKGMKSRYHGNNSDITQLQPDYNLESSVSISSIHTPSQSIKGESEGYTLDQCLAASETICMKREDVESFFYHFNAIGWIDPHGRPLRSLSSALAKWKANVPNFNKTTRSSDDPLRGCVWK